MCVIICRRSCLYEGIEACSSNRIQVKYSVKREHRLLEYKADAKDPLFINTKKGSVADMEEKILEFIMDYAQKNHEVPFQAIEEAFNLTLDRSLLGVISDAIWDRDDVEDVLMENERYVITYFED